MRIDCNITENFLREFGRMCDTAGDGYCDKCEMQKFCENVIAFDQKEQIATVQKWSDAHPRKTILNDLLEKYPKVMLETSGIPDICPRALGYEILNDCNSDTSCVACWNQEIKERAQ